MEREGKRFANRVLAVLMAFAVAFAMVGVRPMMTEAAPELTLTVTGVTYNNNTDDTASATINFTYSGESIYTIDPMIGTSDGAYDYDLDTTDPAGMGQNEGLENWSLTHSGDTWTLVANPLHFTSTQGQKPGAGETIWVGVSVATEGYPEINDQLSLVVPEPGQSVTVGDPTPEPTPTCTHEHTKYVSANATQHNTVCEDCGQVLATADHEWESTEYKEEGNEHIKICRVCGHADSHTINCEGSWHNVGTLEECRYPECSVCHQTVEDISSAIGGFQNMDLICHKIKVESNGSSDTHKAYCERCGYVFSENAPCYDMTDWLHSAGDDIDEDEMERICAAYLHENGDGTATITCACGNQKTVDIDGKIIDNKGKNVELKGFGDNVKKHKVHVTSTPGDIEEEEKIRLIDLIKNDSNMQAKLQEAGITDTSDMQITMAKGESTEVTLVEPTTTTGTGDEQVQSATVDIAKAFSVTFTVGGQSFTTDGNYNVLVDRPTIISIPAPEGFGKDGDVVRVDHTHQGQTYVYYGKVTSVTDPDGNALKVVSWTSEKGLSPFKLSVSKAIENEYMEYLKGNVGGLVTYTKVAVKAATCTETGNVEYYMGSDGKYYIKKDNKYTEVQLSEVTTPALGHNYSNGKCTRCGEADPDYNDSGKGSGSGSGSSTTSSTSKTVKNDDGSTTITVVSKNTATGTVTTTETTNKADGSKVVVKKVVNKDGSGLIKTTETSVKGAVYDVEAVTDTSGNVLTVVTTTENAKKTATITASYKASGKKLTLTGFDTTKTTVSIPESIKVDGAVYKVTKISDNVFKDNAKITKVNIGKNISSIGKNAFNGAKKLKSVVIKGNVKSVGKKAFSGINKNAVIKIDASKKSYNKIKAAITKSGVAKTVKFKRI